MLPDHRASGATLPLRDALLAVGVSALATHIIFKRYEPNHIPTHIFLLLVPPSVLSILFPSNFSVSFALLVSFATYLSSLILSIVAYRLSPLHPLAQYPGPLLHKVSKLWMARITRTGKRHLYLQALHQHYGDIVRIGPNEVSICNVSAILPLMGTTGLPKGPHWVGRTAGTTQKPLIAIDDLQEHARRRKYWNRAFSTASLKGYEEIVAKRAGQLADSLAEQEAEVDLSKWISWFTYDFMSDMAFGGGSEMLRNGDQGSVWHLMEEGIVMADTMGQIPWSGVYARYIPSIGKDTKAMRRHGTELAAKRIKAGSLRKDLFHYLNNEDGFDASPPTAQVISDGALAMIAGSDTTASVLTSLFFCLLSHRETYDCLQAEIDSYFPPGENALDTRYHAEMPYLNAVLNETLRLFPAVIGGSQRIAKKGSGGKAVGPFFLPEETCAFVHFYSIHRDPRYFSPLPESFWPERWLIASGESTAQGEMKKIVHEPTAFIPFSFGPANCVGKNLALQEMRMVVCLVMQKLEMRLPEGYNPKDFEEGLQDFFVVKKPRLPALIKRRENARV
ncbi:hypothetical protein A0H81_01401 [Grifola frondosa]|uniref:Cytochrome P450 67 n=1 Tax=Grifola frondosa TaxID=5627 RepID=A0A1C7MT47_GRIFR|nr:hypothetical protein A0H81_01401 [Grifola frondosa]